MKVALSRVHYPVTTLGPGRRLGIWFQGCSIRCPGCISADTWGSKKPDVEVGALVIGIRPWLDQADGITITGGEPFDQPAALKELLEALRRASAADVLVYSGYAFEELQDCAAIKSGLVDALITDPFLLEAPQTKVLRGSDNQRLHCLTAKGSQAFRSFDRPALDHERKLDVMFDREGVVWLAGIPRRGDMKRLHQLLLAAGHQAQTTEAR